MREPKIGMVYERTFVVEDRHTITFADDTMPAVLSTPMLIAELERTAREAVQSLLEPSERTVGTSVEIDHLAGTTIGFEVRCSARVLGFENGEIRFQVEASDGLDRLARGYHRRQVVDAARLRRRIENKASRRPTLS
jgi:fluoroacetyl-CoA thioesterase